MTKQLSGMSDGSINTLRVQATSLIDGALVTSNELFYEFIYAKSRIYKRVCRTYIWFTNTRER